MEDLEEKNKGEDRKRRKRRMSKRREGRKSSRNCRKQEEKAMEVERRGKVNRT